MLRGWKYDLEDVDVIETIKAGSPKIITEYKVPTENVFGGWVLACSALVNNPLAELEIDYDLDHFDFSAYGFYNMGLVGPNPWGVFTPVYDTTAGVYATHYMPSRPLGFKKYLRLAITAPSDSDVTLINLAYVGVIINNMDLFRQSVKEVLGSELQKDILESLKPPIPIPPVPTPKLPTEKLNVEVFVCPRSN